jgi:hypothetical protein
MKFTKLLLIGLALTIGIFFEGMLNNITLYEIISRAYFAFCGAFAIWLAIKLDLWNDEDRLKTQKSIDKAE